MRHFGLRGLKVETAGQAGQAAGSEGDLVGVVDAVALRDAILRQRQQVLDAQPRGPAGPDPEGETALLREIRDILARIEQRTTSADALIHFGLASRPPCRRWRPDDLIVL